MKVLLVEDDRALAAALGEALAGGGVLVERAASGGEADFLVRTETYDAVILDLGLTDGDGTRWLARWREDGIELPVLVLTARTRWADKAAGFSAGADDYVTIAIAKRSIIPNTRRIAIRLAQQPAALETALAIAASGGTIEVSPTPRTP